MRAGCKTAGPFPPRLRRDRRMVGNDLSSRPFFLDGKKQDRFWKERKTGKTDATAPGSCLLLSLNNTAALPPYPPDSQTSKQKSDQTARAAVFFHVLAAALHRGNKVFRHRTPPSRSLRKSHSEHMDILPSFRACPPAQGLCVTPFRPFFIKKCFSTFWTSQAPFDPTTVATVFFHPFPRRHIY